MDSQLPIWSLGLPSKGISGNQADGASGDMWSWHGDSSGLGEYGDDNLSSLPALVLMILSCVVVFLAYRFYRQRTRPRRKPRPPRLKKFATALAVGRVPAV